LFGIGLTEIWVDLSWISAWNQKYENKRVICDGSTAEHIKRKIIQTSFLLK
jgi:hypothetical protein